MGWAARRAFPCTPRGARRSSFQIIVRAPAGGLSNVNVQAPNLSGPQVTLYREYYLYLASGSSDWASNQNKPLGPGYYPGRADPVLESHYRATGDRRHLSGGALPGDRGPNQPVWVDITVPRTTPAGTYSGVFTVTSDQGNASVTLNLTVWNFTLPVKPAVEVLLHVLAHEQQRAGARCRSPTRNC